MIKKLLCALIMGLAMICQSGDGLFWSATINSAGAVSLCRSANPIPGAANAAFNSTPAKYLRLINGAVVELTADQKAAQDAQEAQADAEAQAAAQVAATIAQSNAAVAAAQAQAWADAQPFAISKYKVLLAMRQVGQLPTFVAFLNADEERKLLWDAAITLDSNDAMVIDAMVQLKPLLDAMGMTSTNFLRACQSDIK